MDLTALENEMRRVLYAEAELLDEGRFDDWLEMLTEDIHYWAPVRLTRERGEVPEFSDGMQHFDDDYETLQLRVRRLHTEFAWAEDPPSRTRHFISNIRIDPEASTEDEVHVKSYILLYRTRGMEADADLLSGERRDVWRRVDGRWRLARRQVILDQATLNTRSISIFI